MRSSRGWARWSSIWALRYSSIGANSSMRCSTGWFTPSSTTWTNSRNSSSSASGKPSNRMITAGGMNCAYWVAASSTRAPAISSSSRSHRARTIGSSSRTGPGAKTGRMSRRAIWWNGGSEVMGGATPIGAGGASSVGRPLPITTVRLVKCSVSVATADTPAWVDGNQAPP